MKDFIQISDFIIENNNQYIIANKPAGLPCVPDATKDKNLKNYLEAYSKHDLHIITRTDRPISGITMYAKNARAANTITDQLKERTLSKVYIAIVEGKVEKESDTLEDYLLKTKSNKSILSNKDEKHAKLAKLTYKTISILDNYTVLEVQLITGRFHQIRAQLAHMGNAIKGDVKYGARRKNKDRSIHLHAYSVGFDHPVTHDPVSYIAPLNVQDNLWKAADEAIHPAS